MSLEDFFKDLPIQLKIYFPKGYKGRWKPDPSLSLRGFGTEEGQPTFDCAIDFKEEVAGKERVITIRFDALIVFEEFEILVAKVDLGKLAAGRWPSRIQILEMVLADNCRFDFTMVEGETQLILSSRLIKGQTIKATLTQSIVVDLFIGS